MGADPRRVQRPARRTPCTHRSTPGTDSRPVTNATPPAPIHLRINSATEADIPLILHFIQELANYERLAHEVVATEDRLRDTLFGPHPAAEVLIARVARSDSSPVADRAARTDASQSDPHEPAGFALFFSTYSTFLARPGLYLEDLFVRPHWRGAGIGRALLTHLARLAVQRDCGRLEWAVLDWNEPAIGFYRRLGARPLDDWTTFRLTGDALTTLA